MRRPTLWKAWRLHIDRTHTCATDCSIGSSLESTMPMAVNSLHSAAIKGRPSGSPTSFLAYINFL